MLSTDFGLLSMLENSLHSLRTHFRMCHGKNNPDPNYTMCPICNKVETYDEKTKSWKCGYSKGESYEHFKKRIKND